MAQALPLLCEFDTRRAASNRNFAPTVANHHKMISKTTEQQGVHPRI
jgi:hypothetical protein